MRKSYGLKDEVEREQEMQQAQLDMQRRAAEESEAPTNDSDD
jgi:hypothetical protein